MSKNQPVNPLAKKALDKFKYEVADELDLTNDIKSKGWGNMTTRDCGRVGGQMVRKMIEKAENGMAQDK
ncbi:alpha/beta-type small acid-soluble spore protein [Selenihalanaerobacter shriftii]|uniref:Small, acid-soluble spore protein, alpha/beta type n=1 Tax=Selenihalanaerobacter shriftii TaxID=142842 RepID=A0A1T4PYY0_9FIRM|nr:alpha/beta-type small acid-soluble spore protein [Selenihalanaerobacter shriftii]SJZ96733.1 Small, acid-soluble spore protein, alpha/beta type [Selenihalanaerobacter shriftii]